MLLPFFFFSPSPKWSAHGDPSPSLLIGDTSYKAVLTLVNTLETLQAPTRSFFFFFHVMGPRPALLVIFSHPGAISPLPPSPLARLRTFFHSTGFPR